MVQQIMVIVDSINDTDEIVDKEIIMTESVVKPNHIIGLGLHDSEQFDFLRQIEPQLLGKQSVYFLRGAFKMPKMFR